MEEEKKLKNKQGKGILVAFILSIFIILGLVLYICYDKGIIFSTEESKTFEKNDLEQTENEDKEEVVDINSDLVQKLYNIFRMDKDCFMNVKDLNNSNLVKLRIAYDNIRKKDFGTIHCSKLTATENGYCGDMNGPMLEAYSAGNMEEFRKLEKENYTASITTEIIEIKMREIFGSDYEIKHESFGISHVVEPSCYFMQYEASSNVYAEFNCEGGGTCGGYSQELVSASKKKEELYIETTLKDTNEVATTVTYKFKKDKVNNNYVFVNVVEK